MGVGTLTPSTMVVAKVVEVVYSAYSPDVLAVAVLFGSLPLYRPPPAAARAAAGGPPPPRSWFLRKKSPACWRKSGTCIAAAAAAAAMLSVATYQTTTSALTHSSEELVGVELLGPSVRCRHHQLLPTKKYPGAR